MLRTRDANIVTSVGKKIFLHGVNLGGCLMMEGYILYGRNISEKYFKSEMARRWGKKELDSFIEGYRNNFITEKDFKNISRLKFNCIRLPFNHKLIENQDRRFSINKKGVDLLKKAVSWCREYGIYCILDMHAAPGSQNADWHSDSNGETLLWKDRKFQERYFGLWEYLADIFKDENIIGGYNILNEPVIEKNARRVLRPFYREAVRRIRAIDKRHIIFLEGNFWSQILEHIGEPFADNLCYSIHYYHPLDFTFNFQRGLKYPGRIYGQYTKAGGEYWDIGMIRKYMDIYYGYSRKWNVPIFVGEFGVNSRCGECYGELKWVKDILRCFKEYGFHWTYWTYKAVANSIFPDGIYQYLANPPWVNRQGHIYGWENFYSMWEKHKREIIESWQTRNFSKNKQLANLLASFTHI